MGHYLAWTWLRLNWDLISKYFDVRSSTAVGKMIEAVTRGFNNDLELKELQAFYEARASQLGAAKRSTETAIENARSNLLWMDKYSKQTVTLIEQAVANLKELRV